MSHCDKIPPDQLLLAASTIALALAKDKSAQEVESLINLVNLVEDMLIAILTQKAINNKALQMTDLSLLE